MSRLADLWLTLRDANVVVGEQPSVAQIETPWFVRALVAFSAWLAALFGLGFILLATGELLQSFSGSITLGAVLIVAAWGLLYRPKAEFFEHLGLALSLVGQVLIAFAGFDFPAVPWDVLAIFQAFLVLVMPNFLHRVFSAFAAASCFALTLQAGGVGFLFSGIVLFCCAWVWLNEFRYPHYHNIFTAIGYGLALALIQFKGSALLLHGGNTWRNGYQDVDLYWGALLSLAALLFVLCTLLVRYQQPLLGKLTLVLVVAAVVVAFASMHANGILIGVSLVLLGFSCSNRTLLVLGMMSLLFYLSAYYYQTDATLLFKSMTLLLVGVVLLVGRKLMRAAWPVTKETSDA